jgi:hypothetical protein
MGISARWIRHLMVGWLWFAGLLGAGLAQAQLTEANVEQFLVELEAADQRRDAATVIAALSEDVVIVFRYAALGDIPDSRFNKTQYRDYLAQAYAAVQDHSSRRYGTRITVSDDGRQAEVFANVEETTTLQGKTSVHVSQQYVLITLEDGAPRIKRVFAELLNEGSDT